MSTCAVNVGVGDSVGVGESVGVGVDVGVGGSVGVGDRVGVGDMVGVGEAEGVGDAEGVGGIVGSGVGLIIEPPPPQAVSIMANVINSAVKRFFVLLFISLSSFIILQAVLSTENALDGYLPFFDVSLNDINISCSRFHIKEIVRKHKTFTGF